MEHSSQSWVEGYVGNHGQLCAAILGAPLLAEEGRSWDSGLLDEPFYLDKAFSRAAAHPATRLITISTSYAETHEDILTGLRSAPGPLILKAAGNEGANWGRCRTYDSLSALYLQPGFMRVGEALSPRNLHSQSQSSGPAFVCSHPFHLDPDYGYVYHPLQKDIDAFLDHARKSGYPSDPVKEAWSAGKLKKRKTGTSFSTPHAGAMIMQHSAGLAGLTSYDLLPGILLAAQDHKPARGNLVCNRAGLVFDCGRSGFGFLEGKMLARRLKQIWDLTQDCGGHSQPVTIEADGDTHLETPAASGPVVNVALLLQFRTDRQGVKAEKDVPLYVQLQSPSGTRMNLPLLIDRAFHGRYDGSIRAGFQTVAFLGERIESGVWTVSCPDRFWGSYKIDHAKIITHTLHPDSPGAVMLKNHSPAL